jgi:hypothetical protein
MLAQTPHAKCEALDEVGNREFVAGLEVLFIYPAGSLIVKRERCQSEQKPGGTPFNDLGRLDVLVITIKTRSARTKIFSLSGLSPICISTTRKRTRVPVSRRLCSGDFPVPLISLGATGFQTASLQFIAFDRMIGHRLPFNRLIQFQSVSRCKAVGRYISISPSPCGISTLVLQQVNIDGVLGGCPRTRFFVKIIFITD